MRGVGLVRPWGFLALASIALGLVVAFWPGLRIPAGPLLVDNPRAIAASFGLAVFQVAAAAFVAALALGFIAAQSVGVTGNSRRLRYFLNDRWMWASSLGTCAIAGAAAATIALSEQQDDALAIRALDGLIFISASVLAALIALWSEQRAVIDPYTGVFRLARVITTRAVVGYGFTNSRPRRGQAEDESFAIRRYSLNLSTADPLGPTSEVFNQAVQDRDRVLLQAVSDAVAGRICQAAFVRYPRTRLLQFTLLARVRPRTNPLRRLVALRSMPVTLLCLHYVVRHSANGVREFRMEAARDPWVMSLYRVLIGLCRHPELGAHIALVTSALVAVVAASSPPDPRVDERAVDGLPEIANMLLATGWRDEARLASALAGWTEVSLGGGPLVERLENSLRSYGLAGVSQARNDPNWYPQALIRNRWIEMLPESRLRSAYGDSARQSVSFWMRARARVARLLGLTPEPDSIAVSAIRQNG